MMASPCGMVGPSEVVTPPRSRSSPSPGVRRGGDLLLESRSSPSPGFGRGRDRLPGLRLSPSPGLGRGGDHRPRRGRARALGPGEAEIVIRGEVESEPWGRARRRSSSELRSSLSPGVVSHPVLEGKPNANYVRARIRTHVHSDYINEHHHTMLE
jgi:hypothetical protein